MNEHHILNCSTGHIHVVTGDDPEVHAVEVRRIEAESAVVVAAEREAMSRAQAEARAAFEEAQRIEAARAARKTGLLRQLAKHPDPLLRQLAEVL